MWPKLPIACDFGVLPWVFYYISYISMLLSTIVLFLSLQHTKMILCDRVTSVRLYFHFHLLSIWKVYKSSQNPEFNCSMSIFPMTDSMWPCDFRQTFLSFLLTFNLNNLQIKSKTWWEIPLLSYSNRYLYFSMLWKLNSLKQMLYLCIVESVPC